MPYVKGFLNIVEGGIDGSGPGIDNSLPGGLPPMIDNSLPLPPPGVWPPLTPGNPIRPVRPDNSLPGSQPHPDHGLPGGSGGHPDNTLPLQPGVIWPPVPGARDKYLVLVVIPGVGWRYVVIDASLTPDHSLPGSQPRPDHSLPGSQPHPDQGLPPGSQPRPDQGLPSTPQPKGR
jgi:hypothetical protein